MIASFFMAMAAGAAPMATPVSTVAAWVQETDAASLQAAFLALEDEYDEAYNEWRDELRAMSARIREARKTNPDATFERPAPVEPAYWARFDELASKGNSNAQVWCLQNFLVEGDAAAKSAEFTRRALAVIGDPGADLTRLPRTLSMGSRGSISPETARALLQVVSTVATDRAVQAEAAYMRASILDRRGADEAMKARAMGELKTLAAAFPAEKWGKRAGGKVFKTERLNIGQVAPEITGKDVDGNDMKLSDFKGKVVVIDFWGFW